MALRAIYFQAIIYGDPVDSRYRWLSSPRVGGGGWDAAHHGHVLHGGEVTENLHVGGV